MFSGDKLLVLVHHRDDGYDGGITSTNLFISDNRERLIERMAEVEKNRKIGNSLMDALRYKIDLNPDPKRVGDRRTEEEKAQFDNLEEELNGLYPFWNLRCGFDDESFDIEELTYV